MFASEAVNNFKNNPMEDSSEKQWNQYSFAFYNLENLFDTVNDPNTLDDDFSELSDRRWNEKRFRKKIKNLGYIIQQIGYQEILHPPLVIGVAEVENEYVLKELVNSKFLKNKGYDFIHFDSPDERGIDTALLYRKEFFTIVDKKAITVYLENEFSERDFTRDILYVKGMVEGQEVHIMVNHWPSRRAGAEQTNYRRLETSKKNRELVSKIQLENPNANIMIMGDFNDDPQSESVKNLVGTNLYNPMELLLTRYAGSVNYRGNWNLFDQIILSNNFLQQHGNSFRFKEANIFNHLSVQEYEGRNKGNPFRTFAGTKYLGGISDHFPVYSIFELKQKP